VWSWKPSVTTYWCDIGTIGIRTPAIRPSSAANMPPQLTTISQSMSPWSVRTLVTLPPATSRPSTRVRVRIRAPPSLALAASS
jgi:hypothetical protein